MKVIAIGETVYDIIFGQDKAPKYGNAGGSAYNAIISVGRMGRCESRFIGEVGDDTVGHLIVDFLEENGVDATGVSIREGIKTSLSLAFLDEKCNAHYQFYKDHNSKGFDYIEPGAKRGDVMLFGSYFAINPRINVTFREIVSKAREEGAMLYYDLNFRESHKGELEELRANIEWNMDVSHIVKASDEDIEIVFGSRDPKEVYEKHISKHCDIFICTKGGRGVEVFVGDRHIEYAGNPLAKEEIVSTVGAGDSFNAGFVGNGENEVLIKKILEEDRAIEEEIGTAVRHGMETARRVCMSALNYIEK